MGFLTDVLVVRLNSFKLNTCALFIVLNVRLVIKFLLFFFFLFSSLFFKDIPSIHFKQRIPVIRPIFVPVYVPPVHPISNFQSTISAIAPPMSTKSPTFLLNSATISSGKSNDDDYIQDSGYYKPYKKPYYSTRKYLY